MKNCKQHKKSLKNIHIFNRNYNNGYEYIKIIQLQCLSFGINDMKKQNYTYRILEK